MPTPRPLLLSATVALLAGCTPGSDTAGESPGTTAVRRLADACVDVGVDGCSTTQGGYFNAAGRRTLYWQIQSGETPDDLSGAAYVFVVEGAGGLRPIASGADGYFYEPPSLVWVDRMPHVAIAGTMRGTGHFNADALYRWTSDPARPLVKIDNGSWGGTLERYLPPDLRIRKGVAFHYGDEFVTAETSLWREADGDCCPTGGEAHLSFEIEGDRLVLKSVERLPPQG